METYLIGLDIGTSSVKGVLMTPEGEIVQCVREKFTYLSPAFGQAEMDPKAYLDVCVRAIQYLANTAKRGRVISVAASSASGNLILLDEKDQPLTNIISWQDKRVGDEARKLFGDLERESFYRLIGWPYGFQAMPLSELSYLKVHDPERLGKAKTVAMSTEYLYHELTGKWGISLSAGVTYYLIDQEKGVYSKPLLDRLGLREDQFPPVCPAGKVLGGLTKEAALKCGLEEGTPLVLGTFDHPSAARGAGIFEEGEMLLSLGTSWVAFFPVKDREKALKTGGLVDPFMSPDGNYGVMTSLSSLSVKLMAYAHRYLDSSDRDGKVLSELAEKGTHGANGLVIDLTEEPDDERLKAFSKTDIARALAEGTVRLLSERLDRFAEMGIPANKTVMVGGPSEDPFWKRLIEETCGLHIEDAYGAFTGAVGAAMISGVGAGVYENEAEAYRKLRKKRAKTR